MQKQIAVILSGCGHRDGSEITEAVSALIALSQAGAQYQVFAPDLTFAVTHPISGATTMDTRNVMCESSRISRGHIRPLEQLKVEEFDGLVLPGGFGAALHLCTWAKEGARCQVHPEAERILKGFYQEQKPIAAICIAPALVARVLGAHGITLTIGNDATTAIEIEKTGAIHEVCGVDDFVTDRAHRLVTTPAYMFEQATPAQIFTGVSRAIQEFVEMA